MIDEPNAFSPSPSYPAEEADAVQDEFIPILESYEDALRRGQAGPPDEWLTELRASLKDVYWLHREGHSRGVSLAVGTATLPQIPGYEVLEVLGKGGMGLVYKARQLRPNRLVALKMILDEAQAGSVDLARFRTEPDAVARLQHPHIVQIYEVGEHQGHPFFSMEYVEGGSLKTKYAGTPQPAHQAAQLVETLARTIHVAHARGIVHRDLKPANILLTAEGSPKITDFGLAKRLDVDLGQTQTGAIVGTPSYMAPEQAAAKRKEVGPASDVYALGAILYELITGRPPFQGTTPLDTLEQVQHKDPVSPRSLQLKMPRDLETICLKCLQKEPEKRYASALALAEDLRRFLHKEPIQARPVGHAERLWRWCRRKPAVAALVAAVALTLLLGTAVASWFAIEARANARQANSQKELAQATARQFAAAVQSEREAKDLAISNLRDGRRAVAWYYGGMSGQLSRLPGSQEFEKTLLLAGIDFYHHGFLLQLPEDPELKVEVAKLHDRLGYLDAETGSKNSALFHYRCALSFWEGLVHAYPDNGTYQSQVGPCTYQSEVGRSYNLIGAMQLDLGQRAEALQTFQQAHTLFQKLVDVDASTMHLRGLALSCHGLAALAEEPAAALSFFQQAITWQQKLLAGNPKELPGDLAQSYNNLGTLQSRMGQREDGLRSLEQARALRVKVVQDNPTNSQFQGDLADSYLTIGLIERETDPAAARRSLEEARGIALKLCQADPSIARFQSLLAEIYNGLGLAQQTADPAAAQHCYEQACGHLEKLVQGIAARMDQLPAVRQYQVALAQSYHNLGTLRREMKQPAAARRSFEQACVLWDWVLERDKGLAGDRVRLRRALTQAYLGEHARATDTVKGITQKLPGAGNLLYDAACVYSMSAATCLEDARLDPVDQSRLAQHYAQQAVALLTRVCTAGYFRSPTAVERLRNAPEMAMLRSREDFRRLLNDLEPIKQAGR